MSEAFFQISAAGQDGSPDPCDGRVRKTAFQKAKGFDETMPCLEDHDLAALLRLPTGVYTVRVDFGAVRSNEATVLTKVLW